MTLGSPNGLIPGSAPGDAGLMRTGVVGGPPLHVCEQIDHMLLRQLAALNYDGCASITLTLSSVDTILVR